MWITLSTSGLPFLMVILSSITTVERSVPTELHTISFYWSRSSLDSSQGCGIILSDGTTLTSSAWAITWSYNQYGVASMNK